MSTFHDDTGRIRRTLEEMSEKYAWTSGGAQYKYDVREIIESMNLALDNLEKSYDTEVHAARSVYQWQLESANQKLADAQNKLRYGMDTQQEAGEEGTITVVKKQKSEEKYGTTPKWTISSIEEMAFKLRHAGGQDDTCVDINFDGVKAVLPFPEAILEPVHKAQVVVPDLPSETEDKMPSRLVWNLMTLSITGVLALAGWGGWEFIKWVTPL